MTRSTLLGSIPLFVLAAACGSSSDDPAMNPGSDAPDGSAGTAGAAGAGADSGTGDSAAAPSCVGTETTDAQLSQALTVLRDELDNGGVPGGAIAIVKDGELVGFGVAGSKRASGCDPITPDTLFRTAGLTQLITSIAALDAVEDGKLSLTAPITTYVPTLYITNDNHGSIDQVTLHHLLANSSMYAPEWNDGPSSVGSDCWPSLTDAFANVVNPLLYATPGSLFHGLWSDKELAGLALQNAEDKPFADVVRQRVLAPLGMGGAFDTATVRASDHAESGGGALPECPNRYPSEHYHGSIQDVAKLAQYLTGGAEQILDAPAFDSMFSAQGPSVFSHTEAAYGGLGLYGAESIGDEELSTSSWGWGFANDMTIWRSRRLAVITLVNAAGFPAIHAARNTSFAVAKIYDPSLEAQGSTWRTYDSPPTPESLPTLAGTYRDDLGFKDSGVRTLEVFVDPNDPSKLAGRLIDSTGTSLPAVFDAQLYPHALPSPDSFVLRGAGAEDPLARFWRDDNGNGYAISLYGNWGPPFFRVTP